MDDAMKCPKCNSEHAYRDGTLWVCPECAHEWSSAAGAAAEAPLEAGVRDAHANPLSDGNAVIVIKDLKVKGSSSVVKGGTKVGKSASPRPPTATTSPARSTASAR